MYRKYTLAQDLHIQTRDFGSLSTSTGEIEMENSIYVGLSRQIALQSEMDTVANNLANINTPGFRAQYIMYKEFVDKPQDIPSPLSMVEDYGQYMSNKPGSFHETGNTFDVAIQGPGFFSVQNAGQTMYTRAGNFTIDANGTLVTADGKPVLDAGGASITVPQGSKSVSIADDGTVSSQSGPFGKLAVTEFTNVNQLKAVGDNLYDGSKASGSPAKDSIVKQGFLEGSNVNPVMEMTHMIDVSRAYQITARLLKNENDRQLTMIQHLTQNA